jgi:hypothetical protein
MKLSLFSLYILILTVSISGYCTADMDAWESAGKAQMRLVGTLSV